MKKALVYIVTLVTILLIFAAPPGDSLYSNPFYVVTLIFIVVLVTTAITHAIYDKSSND